MEQEKLNKALIRLKMLLGIKDDDSDELLSFLLDDTVSLILGYCRIDAIPEGLESLIPVIAADYYRAKGYGQTDAPQTVKSVSEGDRSVSFSDTQSETSILNNYYRRLKPYVNRKGRLPSELE